jgi:hypothetical protein
MRVIKLGLISIIAFSMLITIFSLFIPSHVRISKAIDINASKDSIIGSLANIEKWKGWYPGADTMQLVAKESKAALKAGRLDQYLGINSITDSTIGVSMTGKEIKQSASGFNIYNSNLPNTYTVQWFMDIRLKWYPWEKFSGLLLEKRYGPVMEQGLGKLKSLLESPVQR